MASDRGLIDGEAVVRLREARGWTRRDLQRASGVDYGSLWRIEHGKTFNPRGETLAKLADALDVTVEALLVGGKVSPDDGPPFAARITSDPEHPSAGAPIGTGIEFSWPVDSAAEARQPLRLFTINGHCMHGVIEHGDQVLVKPIRNRSEMRPGMVVICRHDSELLCKRVVKTRTGLLLVADDGTSVVPNAGTHVEGWVWKIVKPGP